MGKGRYSPAMRWFNAWCAVYGFVGGWLLLMLGYLPVWVSLALVALGVPNLLVALPPLRRRNPRRISQGATTGRNGVPAP